MRNLQLVRTDYVLRYHLHIDTEAAKFDCFQVELLGESVLVHSMPPDALWNEVLSVMSYLRGQNDRQPLYRPSVFQPFARIIACEAARERAKVSLRTSMIVGAPAGDGDRLLGPEPDPGTHMEKVNALCTALDLLDMLDRKPKAQRVQ